MKKKILNENWFLICSKQELEKKNDFKTIEIFNKPLLIYNTGDKIKTFINICPHRGSKIKLKKNGNEILKCDYHGWCFNKNGRFLSAPFENLLPKNKYKTILNMWKTETCGDLIFIAPPNVKIKLKNYLNKSYEIIKKLAFNSGSLVHEEDYIWKCNWKTAVENSIDEYHATHLHKNTFKNILNLNPKYLSFNKVSIVQIPLDERYLKSIEKFDNLFFKKNNEYTHIFFFPFTTFSSTMGIFNFIQKYSPVDEHRTCVSTSIYISKKNLKKQNNISKTLINSAIKFNQIVFKEDKEINENLIYDSNYNKKPIYSNLEQRIKYFRKFLKS